MKQGDCILLLLALATSVVLVTNRESVAVAISSTQPTVAADPHVGAKISLPESDIRGRKVPAPGKTLLLAAGQCTECSLNTVDPSRIDSGAYDSVVVLYDSSKESIPKKLHSLPQNVYVCATLDSGYSSQLSGLWTPRLYLLQQDHLIDIQVDRRSIPDFVRLKAK